MSLLKKLLAPPAEAVRVENMKESEGGERVREDVREVKRRQERVEHRLAYLEAEMGVVDREGHSDAPPA